VRHRAQALLLVALGQTVAAVARLFETAGHRVRAWRERFLVEGRLGLVDRSRRGCPPKLSETERAFLAQALERGPQLYGLPVTVWSIRDLQALVQRERGIAVSVDTLHRAVQALGYRYRRPRHDLSHRQDAEAVAAAKRVLDWLQKKPTCSRTTRCCRTPSGLCGRVRGPHASLSGTGLATQGAPLSSINDLDPR
jgi:transposase